MMLGGRPLGLRVAEKWARSLYLLVECAKQEPYPEQLDVHALQESSGQLDGSLRETSARLA